MKVMFQVEGPTDQLVLVELVRKILGASFDVVTYQKRVGGIGEVFRTLEKCVWQAWSLGCAGAVIGVDANGSTPHDRHETGVPEGCRYCRIQARLPRLPDRPPTGPMRFAVFVPVQAVEAWLLHFGRALGKHTPGPPQGLDRREAKRTLWDTLDPDRARVEGVCRAIFPAIDATSLEQLARAQPSFRQFRDAILAWPQSDGHATHSGSLPPSRSR